MREIILLKKINQSYRCLNLQYSKLVIAFFLMFLTSVLEMSGLSILYPLVLMMGGSHGAHSNLFSALPFVLSPTYQLFILFSSVAILYVAKNGILYFTYEYNINFAIYYSRNLIRGLYHAYVYKSLLDFRNESAGSLAHIICVQSVKLVDGIIRPLLVVITELFIMLGIAVLLFFISPGLMVVVMLTCGGMAALFYGSLRNKALQWGKDQMKAGSILQEIVTNTSAGISEIKIFGKEEYLTSKIYDSAVVETKMFHNLEMYQQAPRFIVETIFIVTVVAFFSVQLLTGTAPSVLLAKFSVVAAASFRLLPSINRIVNSYSNFSFNIGPGLALLDTIANHDLLTKSKKTHTDIIQSSHLSVDRIEFKEVSFQYPLANKPVLDHFNGILIKGQRMGIMGASGSGKSTLIKILAGLYIPSSGCVFIDGLPMTEVLYSWQKCIGYVPQEAFIMPGTIKENITFGLAHHDDEVLTVLKNVGLENFILSLPQGIYSEIGEKGIALSGGQRQLICLARALFRQPKILLLDEPTASLDVKNEETVLKAINRLPTDTTIVMVSHKSQNFRQFNVIYVYENGKLRIQEKLSKEYNPA